jgi:hypothetical protein
MAGYVARTGARKKRAILEQREDELRHHIRHEADFEKLERSSERVRDAQLGVIKALLYETEPASETEDQHAAFRANLVESREEWLGLSTVEIVARYASES